MSRILAVDPGDVRIGLAVSDPTRTLARPLRTLQHRSRREDVKQILRMAQEQEAAMILVGIPYDIDGKVGPQARKALRLLEALRAATNIPVVPWDESGSTAEAMQLPSSRAELDARAAAVILQDYLDAQTA